MKQENTDHVFYRSQVKVLPEIDYGKGIYFYDTSDRKSVV